MLFRALTSQWGATIYAGAVSFGIGVLIARSIGPASFGEYATALAVGAMLSIFLDGGFRVLLMREAAYPSSQFQSIHSSLPRLALGHALIAAVMAVVLAGLFYQDHFELALATIACFLGLVLTQYVSAMLRGEGRFEADAGWQISHRSLSALLIVIVIFAGFDRPWQLLSAWSAGTILACLLAPYGIRYWPRFSSLYGELYKVVLPLLWINLATTIYFRFDMLALKYLGIADNQIGQYAAAYRVIEAVIVVVNPVSVMLFRKIRLMASEHEETGIALLWATIIAAACGIVCAMAINGLASPIIQFTYGSHYPESASLLSVLAWAAVFLLPNAVLTQAALAMDLERSYALAATLAAGFNVLFNIVMIRHMGAMASALATIFTEILLMVVLGWVIYQRCRIRSRLTGSTANERKKPTSMAAKYRIGVDASLLAEQMTGIGRYTHEILRRLVSSQQYEWFLYAHRPLAVGEWNQSNVHIRTGRVPKRLLRMLWVQTVMPYLVSKDRVDLFWSPAHRLPGFLSDRIARVVTIHDLVWKHAPETMRPMGRLLDTYLMPLAVKMADQVITVSNHTAKDVLLEMPVASGKICVTPLGITGEDVIASKEALVDLELDAPYILFVGTLEPRKNLSRLLEAYSRLPEGLQQQACIAIAGGKGWGGVSVQDLAQKFDISNRVRVLGYVSDMQLSALYAHALFLAMPSLYEGFGLPLLEAMARGTPVLTSDISSMPEVAGDAGYLVDPYDVDSITHGLSQMIGNDSLREELAMKCRETAGRFSWDRAAEQTLNAFDKAIDIRRQSVEGDKD